MPKLQETIDWVMAAASHTEAAPAPIFQKQAASRKTKLSDLRAVAEKLRNEKDLEVTYPLLHAVKLAVEQKRYFFPKPTKNEELNPNLPGYGLRKLAQALRHEAAKDTALAIKKAALILQAAQGLMLLQELKST
jgi:hypothetical protein